MDPAVRTNSASDRGRWLEAATSAITQTNSPSSTSERRPSRSVWAARPLHRTANAGSTRARSVRASGATVSSASKRAGSSDGDQNDAMATPALASP